MGLLVILFLSFSSFSQTTTINYLTSSLSTTACNVFTFNVAVNGVIHSSLAGGVSFNSTNGLYLDAQEQSVPFSATGFVINYSFVSGYSYDISVIAKGGQFMHLNTSVVDNLNAFQTASTSSCDLDSNVPNWNLTGYGQFNTAVTGTSTTYNVPTFSVSSGTPIYLVVWATGGNPSYAFDNLTISKIIITKTAVAPSFTLTPTTSSLTCGTTSPITFTVNNPGSVTGITNYTWNLGATPNGWKLPNGSAAPATYSTSTNTLTLTPVCGSVQKNISATVTANGNNYNTNASTVSVTLPTMSINGSGSICSGSGNYSVTGLPCNATVAWSITPASGVANLSCSNCTTTSLSYVDNGVVTLTATVSNVCSQQIVKTKTVAIGHATTTCSEIGAGSGSCIQNNFVCPSQLNYWQYAYIPFPGSWGPSGTGYHLEVHGGGYFSNGLTTQDVTSNYFSAWIPGGGGYITVSGMNNCGVSQYTPYVINYIPKSGCSSFYNVSPNPATSSITVRTNTSASSGINKLAEERLIDRISIYNEQGTLVKDKKISKMQTATVNISGLFPGKYVVEIASGTYKESQIIIVQ